MRYLLAILLPTFSRFLCGKPVQTILSIILTLAFWIPGVIHALFIVHNHLADKRNKELIAAIKDTKQG